MDKIPNEVDIAYLRVSTEEHDAENQRADLQEIAPESVEWLAESSSAWRSDAEKRRPVFYAVRERIRRGEVRCIYVWDIDRLYRNRRRLVAFFKLCQARETKIVSYRQPWLRQIVEMPEPWNEIVQDLMVQVLGWLAEDESQKRSDRVRASMRHREDGTVVSRNGHKWGRPSLAKQTRRRIIETYQAHEENISMRELASLVVRYDKHGNAKPISKSTVHKIIREYETQKHS